MKSGRRLPDRSRRRPRRDISRAVIACLLLAVLCAPGFFIGANLIGKLQSAAPRGGAGIQPDEELTTGSILFVPPFGENCRHLLIDNATWHIWDGGIVDCSTALEYGPGARPRMSAARVDIIRDGFRKR